MSEPHLGSPTADPHAFGVTERRLDPDGRATFSYELDGASYTETVTFPGVADPAVLDTGRLALALDLAHVLIGVSYYKMTAPGRVHVRRPVADAVLRVADLAYTQGLGEFAATNGLPLPHQVTWDVTIENPVLEPVAEGAYGRPLVPIGGGKDSALALTLAPGATALAINSTPAQERVADALEVPLIRVGRQLDPLLLARNREGALNGHVPVTAINSAIATVAAILDGADEILFANERSADEETQIVRGVPVNHQYSKTSEFERAFAEAVAPLGVRYLSVTRSLSEIAIVSAVASSPRLRAGILSCNRAFSIERRRSGAAQQWCLECPKCLFTVLMFALFLTPAECVEMFGGDALDDPGLVEGFRALWSDDKPFECVGERRESSAAMARLAASDEWSRHAVVAALGADAAATSDTSVEDLLTPTPELAARNPHRDALTTVLEAARRPVRTASSSVR